MVLTKGMTFSVFDMQAMKGFKPLRYCGRIWIGIPDVQA
jgi:hypothetical protein